MHGSLQAVHTNFHAKSGVCSSKNERVMALGTKEDGHSTTYIYIQAIIQSKLGVCEFARLDNMKYFRHRFNMNLGTFQPGNAAQPTSTIELSVSCTNLADQDFVSKSDPLCVLYTSNSGQKNQWTEVKLIKIRAIAVSKL